VSWRTEVKQVNNVSLQLKAGGTHYADPFAVSGEIENTTDLTVDSFAIYFYGRDANGSPIYFQSFSESTFGIPPGGTAPFSIDEQSIGFGSYLGRNEISTLFYYIEWQWKNASFLEYEVSPFTQLF